MLVDRGLDIDHTTVWRWAQRYVPKLEVRTRPHLKPTNKSWLVDETYVWVKGRWFYIYRAIDLAGATVDFFLSAFRSADATKALLAKALTDPSHPQPRVINTDKAKCYPPSILEPREEGALRKRCRHRPVQYLNNILEQDHRAIKKQISAQQHFRLVGSARRTIPGYEVMHKIRKGQVQPVKKGDIRGQTRFINRVFCLAAQLTTSVAVRADPCPPFNLFNTSNSLGGCQPQGGASFRRADE